MCTVPASQMRSSIRTKRLKALASGCHTPACFKRKQTLPEDSQRSHHTLELNQSEARLAVLCQ